MAPQRKEALRWLYLEAQNILLKARDRYSCGLRLMEYIGPPEIAEARRTIWAIQQEVRYAMSQEETHDNHKDLCHYV